MMNTCNGGGVIIVDSHEGLLCRLLRLATVITKTTCTVEDRVCVYGVIGETSRRRH